MTSILSYSLFIVPFVLLFGGVFSETCTNYTNCDLSCNPLKAEYNTDNIAYLGATDDAGFKQFKKSMDTAVGILKKFPGVVTDDKDILHMTLQCNEKSPTQYGQIADLISAMQWKPLGIKFSTATCNFGGDGNSNYTSIIVLLDAASQQAVGALVDQVETLMTQNGIPVHKKRSQMEPFHSTLGVVTADYPVEEVIQEINTQLPVSRT